MRLVLLILLVALLVAVALYAARLERLDERDEPLLILRRQLAEGKISEEQYLERESALRMTERRK